MLAEDYWDWEVEEVRGTAVFLPLNRAWERVRSTKKNFKVWYHALNNKAQINLKKRIWSRQSIPLSCNTRLNYREWQRSWMKYRLNYKKKKMDLIWIVESPSWPWKIKWKWIDYWISRSRNCTIEKENRRWPVTWITECEFGKDWKSTEQRI